MRCDRCIWATYFKHKISIKLPMNCMKLYKSTIYMHRISRALAEVTAASASSTKKREFDILPAQHRNRNRCYFEARIDRLKFNISFAASKWQNMRLDRFIVRGDIAANRLNEQLFHGVRNCFVTITRRNLNEYIINAETRANTIHRNVNFSHYSIECQGGE